MLSVRKNYHEELKKQEQFLKNIHKNVKQKERKKPRQTNNIQDTNLAI